MLPGASTTVTRISTFKVHARQYLALYCKSCPIRMLWSTKRNAGAWKRQSGRQHFMFIPWSIQAAPFSSAPRNHWGRAGSLDWSGEPTACSAGPAQRAGHRRKELLSVGFTQPHHSYQVWDTSSFDDKVLLGANHFLWSCFYCSLSSPFAGWLQWLVA